MVATKIRLYELSELPMQARQKAINDHGNFLSSQPDEYEDESGKLVETYRDDYTTAEIVESIMVNEYLFFFDGEMAHITHYTGGHERSGQTDFHFHGETILLTKN